MIDLDELVRRLAGLDRGEVGRWIENRWVLPEQVAGAAGDTEGDGGSVSWRFYEVDIARVELIRDIRREFAVDDEATALVLQLLDQVYSLRRQMRRLCDALEAQPPEIRDAVRKALPPQG